MTEIKTIYFDLDETLWDHTKNAYLALETLYVDAKYIVDIIEYKDFSQIYNKHNDIVWDLFRKGKLNSWEVRVLRFVYTLKEIGLSEKEAKKIGKLMSKKFIEIYPHQTALIDGSINILEYVFKKYPLGILTNGIPQAQRIKLEDSGLAGYFRYFVSSVGVGVAKPMEGIFRYAEKEADCRADQLVFIGDDYENDVIAAKRWGWHSIYFDPKGKYEQLVSGYDERPDAVINHLTELRNFL